MPALTRAKALKPNLFKRRKVPMPEMGKGQYVYVRTFSVSTMFEAQSVQSALANKDAQDGRAMAAYCVLGVCDERGERLFTQDDVDALQEWPFTALVRCANAVAELNSDLGDLAETARKKDSRRRKSSSRSGSRSR